MSGLTSSEFVRHAAAALERVRNTRPRVHCLMNTVVQKLVADGLSAIDAIPSMTSSPEEVEAFVEKADALSVNLGTLDSQRRTSITLGVSASARLGRPWVLDPAHCDYSASRATFAQQLLREGTPILRANEAEFWLLQVSDDVVGVRTGKHDVVRKGAQSITIENGHPLTAKVTGTGCLSGAVIAAFLALGEDPHLSAASALLAFGVASELAADHARGPGSFEPALLDALHAISPDDILKRARISHDQG
ncbi:hydroxyethylthiazole kinase [Aquamicrobium zhengzhouense]|uniref:hydroxyethylthiazole kinase n=1 Tax=Aquamicrobium zhengzhouense TaxID=2781738 RepID=A0ABS0SEL6_9HYPH|nr:hydroxyethylthiazole kinase [Aquamicrobium zhengzhouense]MBI1621747.1 hydroxyethylthiazole kinase [Aquamicrobium zhengzhouense]